jgi:hypothetical protein
MRTSSSPIRLAYSILVGPILWFVHFVLVYAFAEFGCRANFNNLLFFPPETIRIATIVITVPVLVLVAIGGVLAFSSFRSLPENQNSDSADDREHFLLRSGFLLSSLFLFIIVMTVIPSFVLNVCDKAI